MWGCGLDLSGSGQGQVAGTCEYGNEPSGSIKCGEFLDWLKTGQLLKKDCAACMFVCVYVCVCMFVCVYVCMFSLYRVEFCFTVLQRVAQFVSLYASIVITEQYDTVRR